MNPFPQPQPFSTHARVPMPAPQLPAPWPTLPIYTLPPLAAATKSAGTAASLSSPTLPTSLAFGG